MENVSLVSSFLRMIFALAIVLGVMIGAMYVLKVFMRRTSPVADSSSLIRVIASHYLGPKSRIILVEVPEQVIVVGLSGQQMTTLAHINDPLTIAKMKLHPPRDEAGGFSKDKIARLLSLTNLHSGAKKDVNGK